MMGPGHSMVSGSNGNIVNKGRNPRGTLLHGVWKLRAFVLVAWFVVYYTWNWWLHPFIDYVDIDGVYKTAEIDYKEACHANIDDVKEVWTAIDTTLSTTYPSKRISGGIFLYPRQAALLATLVQAIADRISHRPITVCETGFGSGHSLALFARVASSMRTVSFDIFDRPYQLPIWKWLNQTRTQHHLDFVAGDSCTTVPAVLSGERNLTVNSSITNFQSPIFCDVLHGSSLCPTDNIDLVEHAPCGALLTSAAMATLDDPTVYFGKHAQWRKLRRRHCITPPICFQEAPKELDRNFFFAQQGSAYTSQFCIAMTTGKCSKTQRRSCDTDLYRVVSELDLNQLCPEYQVPAPR